MALFQSKPRQVEAWFYTGDNAAERPDWLRWYELGPPFVFPECWIIRAEVGEHIVLPDADFRAAYDPVPEIG